MPVALSHTISAESSVCEKENCSMSEGHSRRKLLCWKNLHISFILKLTQTMAKNIAQYCIKNKNGECFHWYKYLRRILDYLFFMYGCNFIALSSTPVSLAIQTCYTFSHEGFRLIMERFSFLNTQQHSYNSTLSSTKLL